MTAAPQDSSHKSSRYFYRDPLAASWMAKHFGVEITNRNGVLLASVGIGLVLDYANREHVPLVYHPSGEPCLIDPDSLHLLEPKVADVVRYKDGQIYTVVPDGERRWPWQLAWSYSRELTAKDHLAIIQRDGKAFHWPEQEAA